MKGFGRQTIANNGCFDHKGSGISTGMMLHSNTVNTAKGQKSQKKQKCIGYRKQPAELRPSDSLKLKTLSYVMTKKPEYIPGSSLLQYDLQIPLIYLKPTTLRDHFFYLLSLSLPLVLGPK
jgi:hypothetical protein